MKSINTIVMSVSGLIAMSFTPKNKVEEIIHFTKWL